MRNPAKLVKLLRAKKEFEERHPRVVSFVINELGTEIPEGSVLELTITKPGKAPVTANVRVTPEDLALLRDLKNEPDS